MKAYFTLIITSLILFSCGEVKLGKTDLIGTWTLIGNEVNGTKDQLKNNIYFVFKDDGVYESGTVGADPSMSGTWSYSEKADSSFLGMKSDNADVNAHISNFGADTISIQYSYKESEIKLMLLKEFNVNELPH